MATDLDISQAVSGVYAQSVLELANESGQTDAVADELAQLRGLWDRDPAFASLMSSAAIDDDARPASLRKIFGGGRVSPLVFNLLLVLNDKRRAMILPWLCDAYRLKLNELRGRREAFVTTAVAIDDGLRAKLREQIKRLSGMDPIFVERVDPDVLGGMKVQLGDKVFDNTVRRRLRHARQALLVGGAKHLVGGTVKFMTEG